MSGHQRYLAQVDFGGMAYADVMKQIEIIGTEILPAVKKYTATAPADSQTESAGSASGPAGSASGSTGSAFDSAEEALA